MQKVTSTTPLYNSCEAAQESQYHFPYHYIPYIDGENFVSFRYWSWGLAYLGGVHLLLSQLDKLSFNSLMDVGCGDGRLLNALACEFKNAKLTGVDCSQRALNFAYAFNPKIKFHCADLVDDVSFTGETVDVVTLIEVIEHLPPVSMPVFIESVHRRINANGELLLTVPHLNVAVTKKHYQHFDKTSIMKALNNKFDVEEIVFFEKSTPILRLFHLLLENPLFILANRRCLKWMYSFYIRKLLVCSESQCRRMMVRARRCAL